MYQYIFSLTNHLRRYDLGSTPMHAAGYSCNIRIIARMVEAGGDLRLHDNKVIDYSTFIVSIVLNINKMIYDLISFNYINYLVHYLNRCVKMESLFFYLLFNNF